jgi:hypothetical protein
LAGAEHERVVEGDDAANHAERLAHEKFTASVPSEMEAPFILRDESRRRTPFAAAGDHRVADHLLTGLPQSAASIMGKLARVLAQDAATRRSRDARVRAEQPARHASKPGPGRRDGGLDVLRRAVGRRPASTSPVPGLTLVSVAPAPWGGAKPPP